jgi:hypothetical protein
MNSKYSGSMGFQRLIKAVESDDGGGGGGLTANSVDSSHIINGSIVGADISTSAILIIETLNSNLVDTQNINMTGDLTCGGDVYFGNNLDVGNELTVNGITTINAPSTFNDNVTVSNDLAVLNSSTFGGNANFEASVTITDQLIVSAITTAYFQTSQAEFRNFTTGTNKIHGTATLVGGTVTVTHSAATANTKVLVTRNNVVTAMHMGHLYVVKAVGSFQIVSTNNQDNNAVDWFFFIAA